MLQQQKPVPRRPAFAVVACVAFACIFLSTDASPAGDPSLLQKARSSLSPSSLALPQHPHASLRAPEAAAAFPLPRSQAEQQQHDTAIRVWIPPFFALCASVSGLQQTHQPCPTRRSLRHTPSPPPTPFAHMNCFPVLFPTRPRL
jgi:hypothetical protein